MWHIGTILDGLLQSVDRILPLLGSVECQPKRVQEATVVRSQFVCAACPLNSLLGMRILAVLVGSRGQLPCEVIVSTNVVGTECQKLVP